MIELQDILNAHMDEFLKNHRISSQQLKAVRAIRACRTSALGSHTDKCDECGYEKISYNSCRNRHCPKCQTFAKEEWLEKQKQNLLDIQYFHAVFTVPDELNIVFLQNQSIMYSLIFKAASETILELCRDKKYLGAVPGITAVLHTWGQTLNYHPHLHCVVTGGGLTETKKWKNSANKFFLPIKVLSRKFRGKFLFYLQRETLVFHGTAQHLNNPKDFSDFIKKLYRKDWVVYCKPPFGNAQKVIDYLGRYTHRVAISNNRIVSLENGMVSFHWRDYSDSNKTKLMTLSANEFIRRFLRHVLPDGFRKIRHFGIFASRGKTERIKLCKRLTNTPSRDSDNHKETVTEKLARILGADFNLCPVCKCGHLSRASPSA
jgi:predicted Zn-ribbon and HTH transcriptional regulator